MSIDWTGYEPFDPGIRGPLDELPEAEARAAFDRLMAAMPERIEQLRRLLARNGVALTTDDDGIDRLEAWFRAEVRADPRDPRRLDPWWYGVVNDLALFVGDVIIGRAPWLHWSFFTGSPRDASRFRHVIMGFTRVANARYNVDIDLGVAAYGHRLIGGRDEPPGQLRRWIDRAVEVA